MSEEQKDSIKKWIKDLSNYVLTPGILLLLVFKVGALTKQIEQTTLTPEQRTRILYHIDNSPNDVDNYVAFLKLDSVSRETRADRLKNDIAMMKIDSIAKMVEKNTVTVFQLKTFVKELVKSNK